MANGAIAIKVFLPTSFTKEVGAKKLSIAIAPLTPLMANGAVAIEVLGAAHPLLFLLTSFSKDVSKKRNCKRYHPLAIKR